MTDLSRASSLYRFAEFAIQNGLQPTELLKEVGLPLDALEHPESLISYRKLLVLLQLSAERSANAHFSLEFGLYQGVGILGPILYLIRNASTVRDALDELGRYYHLHSASGMIKLEEKGDLAMLSYHLADDGLPGAWQGAELAKGVGMHLMRTLLGRKWEPKATLLQHAQVGDAAGYRRLLGLDVQFNSQFNGVVFDAKLLDSPLSAADPVLQRLIRQHLHSLEDLSVDELPTRVQQLMRSFLPNGRVTIETVAEHMLLSPRTLQRYLSQENTSFQRLLDETRQAMAARYLCDSEINLTQLAGILGYSDLSAFSRAFRRWFGLNPQQWIKQLPKGRRRKKVRLRAGVLPVRT